MWWQQHIYWAAWGLPQVSVMHYAVILLYLKEGKKSVKKEKSEKD